ncbi:HlyD family secretion protein [Leptothrix cholodnii SP-6]|uniref:HlyD family secretion protein n=1 Tax=Leptothrix cholodnii (strain ATCC 51168 / LMG 8142 / SP-6) TaxID=395495 RepID=B1Y5U8_LEPCP|nr:HlyD family efflux transporter periplasmic adaptor subunit [Leptothrix cholodnii]ACB35994.1 HlyD family secretion protein [Leptothrix cholodnii SP-6]
MIPDADALLALLQTTRSAATPAERQFVLLNRTREAVPYHAAVSWQARSGLLLHSGVSSVDGQGPYGLWLKRLARGLARRPAGLVDAADVDAAVAEEWPQWWPPHLLWLPAGAADGTDLLLVREVAWREAEQQGLAQWADLWRLADQAAAGSRRRRVFDPGALWLALRRPGRAGRIGRKRWIALALLLLTLLPVRQSLRAPGELVPREPTVVRAAIEGTVRRLVVEPNQVVQAGQVLAELDDDAFASRLQVARQALGTAEAEWRQTHQQALVDPRAKAQLPIVQGKLGERQTELRYLEQQMQRTALVAPHAGVVLVDDAGSWAGRTVQAGEALLRLAQPQDQELEAWLAVGDAIELADGSAMNLHLSSRPADPVAATLRLYAFEAEHRPDGTLAYRLRGTLAAPASERLGARGTVRIDGPQVPLIYAVLRRPLAALREMTGW